MNDVQKRVIEAALEFRNLYADPKSETDADLIEAVDELLEREGRRWAHPGVRDHVESGA